MKVSSLRLIQNLAETVMLLIVMATILTIALYYWREGSVWLNILMAAVLALWCEPTYRSMRMTVSDYREMKQRELVMKELTMEDEDGQD